MLNSIVEHGSNVELKRLFSRRQESYDSLNFSRVSDGIIETENERGAEDCEDGADAESSSSDDIAYTPDTVASKVIIRVNKEEQESKEMRVQLCARDEAFKDEVFVFHIARTSLEWADLGVELRLEEEEIAIKGEAGDAALTAAMLGGSGHIVVFLYDEEDTYSGRVHLEARQHDSRRLEIRIRYIAQLQITCEEIEITSGSYSKQTSMLVLALLVIQVVLGMLFFTQYMKATFLKSLFFSINILFVTGLTDILDTHNPHLPDGSLTYDRDIVKVFLMFYMAFGITVLFTFLETYFRVFMDKQYERVDEWMCDSKHFRHLSPSVRNRLRHLSMIMFLFVVSVVAFRILEGWTLLDSMYYSCAVLITVGFIDDYLKPDDLGKIWLIFWMPFSTLYFFYALGDYAESHAEEKRQNRKRQLLRGLLQSPEDLVALAEGDSGSLSRYEYIRFMLLRLGDVEEDDLMAIEKRFDNLDVNGDGMIQTEQMVQRSLSRAYSLSIEQDESEASLLESADPDTNRWEDTQWARALSEAKKREMEMEYDLKMAKHMMDES